MGPGTIGLAATQVNLLVNTLLATSEGTGAVSWLTYAFRVMYLPIGLFGVSIGTAVLPVVSRRAATDDRAGIRDAASKGLSLMLMLNVPATVGLVTLATPIVQLLLEHGRFSASDTAATARALQLYAAGLIGYSATRIVSPTFYALRDSRTPVIVSIGAVVTNIVFSFTLVKLMGFLGLALSTSLAALANGGVLTLLLRRRLNGIEGRRLVGAFVKVSSASAVMAVVAAAVAYGGESIIGEGFTRLAVRVTLSIGAGLGALAASARVLRIQEFEETATLIRSWLWRRGGRESP
jgi:putative peptidoglycan lipid II flippase